MNIEEYEDTAVSKSKSPILTELIAKRMETDRQVVISAKRSQGEGMVEWRCLTLEKE
jgi:hypothetical protein